MVDPDDMFCRLSGHCQMHMFMGIVRHRVVNEKAGG